MSGGFRDTFTKEDQKDELLGYDDTAFYYFAGSVLLVVAIPWSFSVLYNLVFPGKAQVDKDFPAKSRSGSAYRYCQTSAMKDKVDQARVEARRCSGGAVMCWMVKTLILISIWVGLFCIVLQLGEEKEIKKFDPFEILEVTASATNPEIKKAYRKLSLIYHPDKNPDDPLAASKFIQITKAFQALTDPAAKMNYEKYGNPDGPQTTKVGIGLPRFLLEKENHLMILCTFFFLLLFVIPMTFVCYYQRTKNYAANGVMIETLQFLGGYIAKDTRLKSCPEFLAASAESRGMPLRESDNEAMRPLSKQITEHAKRKFNPPIIIRNTFLIWAHMQRLHEHMTPELLADLHQLLRSSTRITQAMIEIACMREWFFTAQAMIEFRRCLIQALDVKSSQLLQIPHFDEDTLSHCKRGKHAVTTLLEFIGKAPEERKGLAKMTPQEIQDVEEFCLHVSDMELRATVEVEDEKEIVVGDVATITVEMKRRNLRENDAIGPVHAPFFPEPKFEEWWLFLVEAGPSTRIIAFERIKDTERFIEEKLRFQVTRPGKHQCVLWALCDSYAGIDQKVDLNFHAYTEDEIKRQIVLHPDDEELDLQPTLFQQFMGEMNREEESEEEDEEQDKRKSKSKLQAPKVSDEKDADQKEDNDDKDDDDDDDDDSDSEDD